MATHPTTEHLDALAGVTSSPLPMDSDEAEYLALVRDHPECICPTCRAPLWHPRLRGALAERMKEISGLLFDRAVEEVWKG